MDNPLTAQVSRGPTEQDGNSIRLSVPLFDGRPIRYYIWRDHFLVWLKALDADKYIQQPPLTRQELESKRHAARRELEAKVFAYIRSALPDGIAIRVMGTVDTHGHNGTQALRTLDQMMEDEAGRGNGQP